ncbi:MAG: NAD(P)-binding domain-containing protein, partial [Veillonella parvula]
MSKTVGIIGLGLLGGSLAKALKEYTDYEVVGYARRQEVCDAAIQDGVVKAAWTEV